MMIMKFQVCMEEGYDMVQDDMIQISLTGFPMMEYEKQPFMHSHKMWPFLI